MIGLWCCWWPAVLLATPGSYVCIRFLQLMTTCSAPTDAAATAIAAHAAAAACAARRAFRSSLLGGDSCAKTHGSSKPLNGSQAAQRLSHSARRSVEDGPTAIRVCALARRRLPGSHAMPGIRGGGDSVERGDASSLDGWRPSPDLERCCKSAQYSFPPVTSSRYVTLPVNPNGQTFR